MTDIMEKSHELSIPKDFTPPEELYKVLIEKVLKYHPSTDISLIEKAYKIATAAHEGQVRKSGEPYIMHPLCVSIILAELELDKETIVAGILHDIVEDTALTNEDIEKEFSSEVLLLVDGVTKLTQLNFSQDKLELEAENLRKMFIAMSKDIRVILIKLADRLHNLRTLQYQPPEKQVAKARETMDIYAPIAGRLGISKIKVELDDLSIQYLEPDVYKKLKAEIDERLAGSEKFIQDIIYNVKECVDEAEIHGEAEGRVKHFFSIYKKMKNQGKTLDQIYDMFAVRILVDSVKDCYAVLGILHEKYKPIPGRFKDYIAMSKPNRYQSLHTTLMSESGQPFEIQIRTHDMHKTAEYGIAAHWKYKEGSGGTLKDKEEEKLNWLRQILDLQRDASDNEEFMNAIKSDLDLFTEEVHCFTPDGDVKNLPMGSTTIDFAYSVHTAIGNKMVGARVNNQLVPITYAVQNGDIIEIITSYNSKGPSRDWLNIVKSAQTKAKINQWFKQEFKEENISKGKELLHAYCKEKGYQFSEYTKEEHLDATIRKYNFKDWNSVLAAIGHGGLKESQVMNKLMESYNKEKKQLTDHELLEQVASKKKTHIRRSKGGIVVKGMEDLAVRFSRCCSPIPGDEVVGYITRGRGISVHRTDCINLLSMNDADRTRLTDVEWHTRSILTDVLYSAEIKIYTSDRKGLLFDISKVFTEENINVTAMNSRTNSQGEATISVSFDIKSTKHLNQMIKKLNYIEGVLDIIRTTG